MSCKFREIPSHPPLSEAHPFEPDAPEKAGERLDAGLFADIVLGVDELKYFGGRAQGLLEIIVELRKFPHRVIEAEDSGDERARNSWGHFAVLDLVAAQIQQQSDSDDAENIHQRRTDRRCRNRAQVGAEQTAAAPRKREISHFSM